MGGSDLLSKSVVFAGSNLSWPRDGSPEEQVPIGFRCSCQFIWSAGEVERGGWW